MLHLILRNEQAQDVDAIFKLTESAFKNAEHTDHTEQFIVNALRKTQQLTLSIVAEREQQLIGHVAISPVEISSKTSDWYGLGPISVAPEYQQQGVGSALMQYSLQQLKQLGAAGCVVLGDPAYYSKFGFKVIPNLTLADVPAEYFQALSFTDMFPQGEVTYSQAFTATQ